MNHQGAKMMNGEKEQAASSMKGFSASRGTILIVDDEEDFCDVVANILQENGFFVNKAYNVPKALKVLDETTPDLMLIDVMMPEIDGLSLIRDLVPKGELLGTPIIVVSAKTETRDLANAWMAGADGFLAKPFTAEELMDVIDWALSPSTP